ncbi:hypothetical protein ONS95_005176 [Cadophora gregata]|uniref:uncharacterized protein n=1 Tax=Cadophora gregata TaxID=51156 RepID=UPI0026DC5189|nr:uncharacterized protein ONS95_005176 [Cadophora gregata]KAK0104913.1 hypothetical protein ONS95_005176 [Cadophora gregata]
MSRSHNKAFSHQLRSQKNSAAAESSESEENIELEPKRRGRPPGTEQAPVATKAIPAPSTSKHAPGNPLDRENIKNPAQKIPGTPPIRDARVPCNGAPIPRQIQVQVPQNSGQSHRESIRPQVNMKKKKVLPFWSKPGAEFVQLWVGPQAQVFSIHLDLISHYSSYFRDAFNRQHGIEGQTKTMLLRDVEVSVFGLFNQWLYTKQIDGEGTDPDLMDVAKLWSYGSVWKVWQLQNEAMRVLIPLVNRECEGPQEENDTVLQKFIEYAYTTREETALKRLAVHRMMSFVSGVINVKRWIDNFPDGMLADFTVELMKRTAKLPKDFFTTPRENPIFMVAARREIDLTE